MALLPVLNIKQFNPSAGDGDFYANIFSNHLSTYHASITKPHKHDFYMVVLFTQGTGTHEIDFNHHPIKHGSLFVLRPGQTHYWELSNDIEGYIFFHSHSFYQLLFPNKKITDYPLYRPNFTSPIFELSETELIDYTTQFKNLYDEYTANKWLIYRRFALLVDLLYIDLSRKIIAHAPTDQNIMSKSSQWLSQLQLLIDTHYMQYKQPQFYADTLNITVKHLNKMVKKATNKTSSELIHARVLLEAKRLLTHGDSTIQEIAFELGFEDVSYFSRFFKKKTGLTPSAFSE